MKAVAFTPPPVRKLIRLPTYYATKAVLCTFQIMVTFFSYEILQLYYI